MRGESAFQRLKRKLGERGFSPSSLMGQNFLVDANLLRSIAGTFALGAEDLVVEIGPGPGSLTRELLATGAEVLAFELDPRLGAFLIEEAAGWEHGDRLWLVLGDILERGRLSPRLFEELSARGAPPRPYTLMSNLPYSVAGPVLANLGLCGAPPARVACLVQWEMGRRLAAAPGTKEYGPLGILVQAAFEAKIQKRVSPQVFRPRPKVDSALVTLRLREGARLLGWAPERREAFGRFLRRLFAARRKALRNGLKGLGWSGLGLSSAELNRRPEQLGVEELLGLFHRGFVEEGLDV
ncbi:MAG TPA: ribosomal RNA small subunit methyltransferase A [Planctomycetes bacterium]|nr:ribosomal RNA small subunit methyltransferase A [Planctomycetota bacterium]